MDFAILIIFQVIVAMICAVMADRKGRSAIGWFLLGVLFPLIALIIILFLPHKVRT
jgi:hypothetical protein